MWLMQLLIMSLSLAYVLAGYVVGIIVVDVCCSCHLCSCFWCCWHADAFTIVITTSDAILFLLLLHIMKLMLLLLLLLLFCCCYWGCCTLMVWFHVDAILATIFLHANVIVAATTCWWCCWMATVVLLFSLSMLFLKFLELLLVFAHVLWVFVLPHSFTIPAAWGCTFRSCYIPTTYCSIYATIVVVDVVDAYGVVGVAAAD
jgi:hypothetical protein